MHKLWGLSAVVIALSAGCAKEAGPPPEAGRPSHIVRADAPYFLVAPKGETEPDGTLTQGTRIRMIEAGETYSLVRSVQGVKAYVESDALITREQGEEMGVEDD